jgi:spore coat polysaccharide biosynthesis protein SpsF (cytidylyltransferase family)
MLRFMLDRLKGLKVGRLIVATSDRPDDDRVEAVAQSAGVACVRGPEQDVLARFALALRENPADSVVRLTADCPLIDPEVVNQLIARFRRTGADYASNTLVRTFPVGLDAEVMTAGALEAADREAADPVEREHVTPFIYRRPARFRLAALRQDRLLGRERWTVDTPADLDHVRRVIARLQGRTDPGWEEILDVLGESPSPASPLRILRAGDIEDVVALALHDPLRAGRDERDPSSLRSLLERSLDDPAVRAWIVMTDTRLTGALVITVDDCVGEIGLLLARDASVSLSVVGQPLQAALTSDQQMCRLLLQGPLDAATTRVVRAAGYHSEGTDEVWDRHLQRGST